MHYWSTNPNDTGVIGTQFSSIVLKEDTKVDLLYQTTKIKEFWASSKNNIGRYDKTRNLERDR